MVRIMLDFPRKLKGKTVKWYSYSGQGEFGKIDKKDIVYLAVVTSEDGVELLRLDKHRRVIMATPYKNEEAAKNVSNGYWYDMKETKRTNVLLVFLFLCEVVLELMEGYLLPYEGLLLLFKCIIYIVCLIIVAVSGFLFFLGFYVPAREWEYSNGMERICRVGIVVCSFVLLMRDFPRYGEYMLIFTCIKNIVWFIIFLELLLGLFFLMRGGEKTIKLLLGKIFVMLILLIPVIYMGNSIVNIGIDAYNGPTSVNLTYSSYFVRHGRRGVTRKYITGTNYGKEYTFIVNGCDSDIVNEINNRHPAIRVTYYERSRVVKHIKIRERFQI